MNPPAVAARHDHRRTKPAISMDAKALQASAKIDAVWSLSEERRAGTGEGDHQCGCRAEIERALPNRPESRVSSAYFPVLDLLCAAGCTATAVATILPPSDL